MKLLNFNRSLLTSLVLGGAVLVTGQAVAASSNTISTGSTAASQPNSQKTAQPAAAAAAATSSVKQVQNFQYGDLSVQFRYEDAVLTGLRLLNMGKKPIEIDLLNQKYVLGPRDSVLLDPPNLNHLQLSHGPWVAPIGNTGQAMQNQFKQTEQYNLEPSTTNNKVSN